MHIHYKIKYIYIPGPRIAAPPARGGGGAAMNWSLFDTLLDELTKRSANDPAVRKKLAQIKAMIGQIREKIQSIASPAIRASLEQAIESALNEASSGDVDQAEADIADTLTQATKAADLSYQIKGELQELSQMSNGLPSPARGAVLAVLRNANMALTTATSLDQLSNIASILHTAVDLTRPLVGLAKGSPELAQAAGKLAGLADKLLTVSASGFDGGGNVGMGIDQFMGTGLGGQSPTAALAGLRSKTTDHFKQQKFLHLEALSDQIQDAFYLLPNDAAKKAAAQGMQQVLALAGQGQLDEAIEAAHALLGRMTRMDKLATVVNTKFDNAMKAGEGLDPASKEVFDQFMQAAQAARQNATTPEDFEALDRMLLDARMLAEKLTRNPPTSAIRSPELRQLKAMTRQLAGGPPAQAQPGDRLNLSQGRTGPLTNARGTGLLNNRAPGTAPLPWEDGGYPQAGGAGNGVASPGAPGDGGLPFTSPGDPAAGQPATSPGAPQPAGQPSSSPNDPAVPTGGGAEAEVPFTSPGDPEAPTAQASPIANSGPAAAPGLANQPVGTQPLRRPEELRRGTAELNLPRALQGPRQPEQRGTSELHIPRGPQDPLRRPEPRRQRTQEDPFLDAIQVPPFETPLRGMRPLQQPRPGTGPLAQNPGMTPPEAPQAKPEATPEIAQQVAMPQAGGAAAQANNNPQANPADK